MSDVCRCGSAAPFAECCGAILAGDWPAATAEQLMRSRFTAFAVGDVDYLLRSWAPETRPQRLTLEGGQRWTGLEILATVDGRELAAAGVVEFRAHYELGGVEGTLHERSSFRRHDGRWVYVGGSSD